MITLQAIFNAAWAHFIVGDGKPAYFAHACRYLDNNGNKCAVGLCIPDGHEAQSLEGDFQELVENYPELFDDRILAIYKETKTKHCAYNTDLSLQNFQYSLHDGLINRNTEQWAFSKERMRDEYLDVAKRYNLTVPA